MLRGVGDIFQILGTLLPPWAVAVLGAALLLVAGPAWFDTVRIKQIKGCIRRMLRAEPAARPALVSEALDRAAARPARLVALVREAHKYAFVELAEEGLQRLRAGGKSPEDVRVLHKLLHPPPEVAPTPLEAAIRVEQLIDAGLWVGAAEQLERSLQRYPHDAELEALGQRLHEARQVQASPSQG